MAGSPEYKRQWALDNAEKVKEQKRACYLRHKERYLAEAKQRYEENKEDERAKSKQRYEANKESYLAGQKAWYNRVKDTPEYKDKRKEYYERTKDRASARRKEWAEENKDAINERRRLYREQNKELITERKKLDYEKNKDKYLARAMMRKRKNRRATPVWARKLVYKKYVALREDTAKLEQEMGTTYHVDHICPIQGSLQLGTAHIRLVSGLNVDYNLQLLPAADNIAKKCYSWPDMWDYTKEDLAELAARSVPCDMELPRFNIKDYKGQEDM